MFGLFWHRVLNRKIPLVRGFDDVFLAPHSRHTEVSIDDIRATKEITILAESDEQDFSSVWQTAEERSLSWDIRNTTV